MALLLLLLILGAYHAAWGVCVMEAVVRTVRYGAVCIACV